MENEALFRLDQKSALVTGAGSGIGLATARRLAAAGARVLIVDRDEAAARSAASALASDFAVADVADEVQMRAAARVASGRSGRLDILVNNAGVALPLADIADTTREHFEAHLVTNAWGVLNGMRAARPFMGPGSAVVNTASVLGLFGTPGYASYSASKHAVIALTKAGAIEFGPSGIRVNAVAPTTVDTPMLHSFPAGAQEARAYADASTLGMIIHPEHVAALIHFLVSDDCPVISGQTIAIDAGITAGVSASRWAAAGDSEVDRAVTP